MLTFLNHTLAVERAPHGNILQCCNQCAAEMTLPSQKFSSCCMQTAATYIIHCTSSQIPEWVGSRPRKHTLRAVQGAGDRWYHGFCECTGDGGACCRGQLRQRLQLRQQRFMEVCSCGHCYRKTSKRVGYQRMLLLKAVVETQVARCTKGGSAFELCR